MDQIINDREIEKKLSDKIEKEYNITIQKEDTRDCVVFSARNDGQLPAVRLVSRTAAMHKSPQTVSAGRLPNMADIERVETNLLGVSSQTGTYCDDAAAGGLLSGALAYQNLLQVPLCLADSLIKKRNETVFGEALLKRLGFQYIYDRPLYVLNTGTICAEMLRRAARGETVSLDIPGMTLQVVAGDELLSLAHFVNARLCRQYGFFLIRNASYYEQVQAKLAETGGNLFQIMEHGVRKGYFACTGADVDDIREVVFDQAFDKACYFLTEKGTRPSVMARIVNLPGMLKNITGNGRITLAVRLRDPVIAENDGLFIWYINEEGSRMERVEDPVSEKEKDSSMRPEVTTTIGDFTAFIFAYMKLKQNAKFDSINLAGPAWLDNIY